MAIEFAPRPSGGGIPTSKDSSMYLIAGAAVLGLLFFFGLYFYEGNLERKILEIGVALEEEQKEEMEGIEASVLAAKEKIDDFALLFNDHKKTSQFFSFLHSVCHPKVSFSSLDLNVEEGTASLSGKAESFVVLGQQMFILRRERDINNVYLSAVSLGKAGDVNFSLSFSISPRMFK